MNFQTVATAHVCNANDLIFYRMENTHGFIHCSIRSTEMHRMWVIDNFHNILPIWKEEKPENPSGRSILSISSICHGNKQTTVKFMHKTHNSSRNTWMQLSTPQRLWGSAHMCPTQEPHKDCAVSLACHLCSAHTHTHTHHTCATCVPNSSVNAPSSHHTANQHRAFARLLCFLSCLCEATGWQTIHVCIDWAARIHQKQIVVVEFECMRQFSSLHFTSHHIRLTSFCQFRRI